MPTDKEYEELLKKYNRLQKRRRRDREQCEVRIECIRQQDKQIEELYQLVAFYSPVGDLESIETLN